MEGAPVSCGSGLVYKIMSTDNAPLGNLTRPVAGFPVYPHSNLKLPPERSKPANEWALIRSRVNIEINLPDERCDLKRQEGWPYKDCLSLK